MAKELVFTVEIRQVKSQRMNSGDMEYRTVLVTDDPHILDLGKLPSDKTYKVAVLADEKQ